MAKRALAELTKLQVEPSPGILSVQAKDGDALRWDVAIAGPEDSPYAGGTFDVSVDLSDGFPFKAPVLSLQTDIYHVNLGLMVAPARRSGEHLMRMEEKWHPSMKVADLLLRIVALMRAPFVPSGASAGARGLGQGAVRARRSPGGADSGAEGSMRLLVETPEGEVVEAIGVPSEPVEVLASSVAEASGVPLGTFTLALIESGQELSLARALSEYSADLRAEAQADDDDDPPPLVRMVYRPRLETCLVDALLASGLRDDPATYEKSARLWTRWCAGAPGAVGEGDDEGAAEDGATTIAGEEEDFRGEEDDDFDSAASGSDFEQGPHGGHGGGVAFACPICNMAYSMSVMGIHLEGHFAFEASQLATATDEESKDEDAALAARLQREEMESTLLGFESLAADRLAAMRLATDEEGGGQGGTARPSRRGRGGGSSTGGRRRRGAARWTCLECTMENGPEDGGGTCCAACGADRPPAGDGERQGGSSSSAKAPDAAGAAAEAAEEDDGVPIARMPHIFATAKADDEEDFAGRAPRGQKGATPGASSSSSPPVSQSEKARRNAQRNAAKKARMQAVLDRALGMQSKLLSYAAAGDDFGDLDKADDEFADVAAYFSTKLGAMATRVHSVRRLRSAIGKRFRPGSSTRIMFHGCKCLENEASILSRGFSVGQCISGGRNYGTWFAYAAAYSDAGFAFNDNEGIRHMFVCVVSNAEVVLDNSTMRVVGQDCAYPLWLVKYTHSASGGMSTFNVGAYGRWPGLQGAAAQATQRVARSLKYEVKDGAWVQVMEVKEEKAKAKAKAGKKK